MDSLQSLLDSLDDGGGPGDHGVFQLLGIGHGDINRRNPLNRSIQIVKGVSFVDDGSYFGAYSRLREPILHGDQPTSLDHTCNDAVSIDRLDGPEVDDFAGNALFGQFLGSLQGVVDVAGVADDGDVLAFPHDLGLADRQHKILAQGLVAYLERLPVEIFVFQENHNFFGPDSGLQQPFVVLSIIGGNRDESRNV